jgi:hypothetical protein
MFGSLFQAISSGFATLSGLISPLTGLIRAFSRYLGFCSWSYLDLLFVGDNTMVSSTL